ncbi:ABC transporter substrate-binding protein [Alicyclobacillus cellulosilyticus]|uniref:ABC transporter substrate-binding protein n=1 Tax=Alicyclobacillus cellulosilyticus TaxID=1003997 RepID=A0A917KE26_9BACL|nr:sugar ABC transporter substrate-binding protein [Alicyclobacillus cellulosilyticus]GGJ08337.1 ABC transporter substrate-binding protein [Alicyclobacillus cellulosilyticus]
MLKKKAAVASVSALAMLGLVAGAQVASATAMRHGAAKKATVTIRFTWWGDPVRNKVYNGVIQAFEKKYPNIIVNAEPTSWSDYWTKLSVQMAGGNAPDVIGMHQFYVTDYAKRGQLLDLTPYVKDGTINLHDFPKAVQDSGKVNGKLVMIAQGVTMSGQVYNKTLFQQMGVPLPKLNWTWDDFIKEATALKQAFTAHGMGNDHWGADDESGAMQPVFNYFVRQRGKNLFTKDGKLGFTFSDLKAWFTMWDNLRKKGVIPDAATAAQNSTASREQSLFVQGKVGITAIPANQIYLYQTDMPNQTLGLVGEPMLGNKSGAFVEGAYLAVPKSSKHPKEAATFINFFINDPNAGKIFKIEQGMPGSVKIDKIVKPLLTPTQQQEVAFIDNRLKLAGVAPNPPKGYSEVATLFTQTAQAIAFGQKSIDQACNDFLKQAEQILGK